MSKILNTVGDVMFEKLSDTLNLLMAEKRINANELARCTGLPASTIKKIRNRDNPNPTLSTLLPLADYFSVSLSQLVGGEPLPEFQIIKKQVSTTSQYHCVPLLSWEEAAAWPDVSDISRPVVVAGQVYSDYAYALEIQEDSFDNLAKGTMLIIDSGRQFEHRDMVIVFKNGQKMPSLKQVLCDEEHVYLKSLIPGCNITSFTSEHKMLGVVMEYRREIKKI